MNGESKRPERPAPGGADTPSRDVDRYAPTITGRLEGQRVANRYELISRLGEGEMGEVWKAYDPVSNQDVALKLVPTELSGSKSIAKRIQDNYRLTCKLRHDNIATVMFIDQDGLDLVLVMELIAGRPLRDYWLDFGRSHPLKTVDEALRICAQLASALDYAHAHGIMHRDVKPENVMLTADGLVKLLDFGLAEKIIPSQAAADHRAGESSGTRPYMSPEQWRGEEHDGSTDQYALAVMLYELLCGHPPFENSDPALLREQVWHEPAKPLQSLPSAANAVLMRALAKTVAERFPTCTVFIDSFRTALVAVPPKPQAPVVVSKPIPVPKPELRQVVEEPASANNRPEINRDRRALSFGLTGCLGALALGAGSVGFGWHILFSGPSLESLLKQVDKVLNERAKNKDGLFDPSDEERAALALLIAQIEKIDSSNSRLRALRKSIAFTSWRNGETVATYARKNFLAEKMTLGFDGASLELVLIPAADFSMGSPESEAGHLADEKPHAVRISRPFYMAMLETPAGIFRTVMGDPPGVQGEFPAAGVSWFKAKEFCALASQRSERVVRLPYEAEWEWACCAGSKDPFGIPNFSSHSANLEGVALQPGGKYPSNAFGLRDMHGNVWEWCEDFYHPQYYSFGDERDPKGPGSGPKRVLRGGSYKSELSECRSAARYAALPEQTERDYGFRIVVEVP